MKTIVTLLAIAIIIGAMMINMKRLHDLVAPEDKKQVKEKTKDSLNTSNLAKNEPDINDTKNSVTLQKEK